MCGDDATRGTSPRATRARARGDDARDDDARAMSNWAAMRARARGGDDAKASVGRRARDEGRRDDDDARKRARTATTARDDAVVVKHRAGLLDASRVDEARARARRERAAKATSSSDDGATRAAIEACRLRAVSHLCMDFEKVAGPHLGKRWCSAFEEWLASASEDEPLVPAGDACGDALAKKLRAKKDASDEAVEAVVRIMMSKAAECARVMRNEFRGPATSVSKEERADGVVSLRVGKTEVRLNGDHFNKLKTLHANAASGEFVERDFLFDAFAMVCRYDAAAGGQFRFSGGSQASLHGQVFDVLRDCFKVECELFASPLNCRWPTFYSKYVDVDEAFGSLGDFRECKPRSGAFEANPPFDEDVVARMAEHLLECLGAASSALTFVVVTPHWPNRPCWEKMRRSKFCSRAEVISVREHGYYEGAQHRKKSRYRLATSDTSVLFLQNESAVESNPATDEKISLLREAFRAKRDAKK